MPTTPMYLEYTIISILLHIVIWTSVKSLSEQEPPLKIGYGKIFAKRSKTIKSLNIWKNSMEKVIKSDLFITLQ